MDSIISESVPPASQIRVLELPDPLHQLQKLPGTDPGDSHLEDHILVPPRRRPRIGESPPLEAELFPARSPRRHRHGDRTVDRRDGDLRPLDRLRVLDREVEGDIPPFPPEKGVGDHPQEDEQVAAFPGSFPPLSRPGDADPGSLLRPRRDLHLDPLLGLGPPRAAAGLAPAPARPPGPPAGATGLRPPVEDLPDGPP